jgi:hypothetical protein
MLRAWGESLRDRWARRKFPLASRATFESCSRNACSGPGRVERARRADFARSRLRPRIFVALHLGVVWRNALPWVASRDVLLELLDQPVSFDDRPANEVTDRHDTGDARSIRHRQMANAAARHERHRLVRVRAQRHEGCASRAGEATASRLHGISDRPVHERRSLLRVAPRPWRPARRGLRAARALNQPAFKSPLHRRGAPTGNELSVA